MRHSTGNRTKAEQARFDKMKEMGICMACYQLGMQGYQYVEIHHLLSGNKRIGHMATVSLCPYHHRGAWEGVAGSLADARAGYGASVSHGSKLFRAEFGTDKELLAMQNEFLGVTHE